MRRRRLLFVTCFGKQFDEGLSYAIHLAKTLGKDLSVLLVKEKKGMLKTLTDMMAASAFAEACEPTAAMGITNDNEITSEDAKKKSMDVEEKCRLEGIDVQVRATERDLVPAIKESMADADDIEMVLLGPTVTGGAVSARELNRLVKTATKPVVTIARHANVA